jgi:hypothetical protein
MPLQVACPLGHTQRPVAEQVWPGTEQLLSPVHCTQRLLVGLQYGAPGLQSPLAAHCTQVWVLVLQTPPERPSAQSLVCTHCTHRPLSGSQTAPKPQLLAVHLASHALVLGLQTALPVQSLVSVHATHRLLVVLQYGSVAGQSMLVAHCAHVWLVVLQTRGPKADIQSPDCRHCTHVPVALSQSGPAIEPLQLLLPWH